MPMSQAIGNGVKCMVDLISREPLPGILAANLPGVLRCEESRQRESIDKQVLYIRLVLPPESLLACMLSTSMSLGFNMEESKHQMIRCKQAHVNINLRNGM